METNELNQEIENQPSDNAFDSLANNQLSEHVSDSRKISSSLSFKADADRLVTPVKEVNSTQVIDDSDAFLITVPKSIENEGDGQNDAVSSASTATSDNSYPVTFNVIISQAVPKGALEYAMQADMSEVSRKQLLDNPKQQHFLHCEYDLLPDGNITKVDVVSYGIATRIFNEKQEPSLLKTWQEEEKTWLTFAFSETVQINKEMLLKLLSHKMDVYIWDGKERINNKARFDRPKNLRLARNADVSEVETLITWQANNFMELQPSKTNPERPLPVGEVEIDSECWPPKLSIEPPPKSSDSPGNSDRISSQSNSLDMKEKGNLSPKNRSRAKSVMEPSALSKGLKDKAVRSDIGLMPPSKSITATKMNADGKDGKGDSLSELNLVPQSSRPTMLVEHTTDALFHVQEGAETGNLAELAGFNKPFERRFSKKSKRNTEDSLSTFAKQYNQQTKKNESVRTNKLATPRDSKSKQASASDATVVNKSSVKIDAKLQSTHVSLKQKGPEKLKQKDSGSLGDADSTMSVGDQKGSAAITRRKKKDLSKETAEEARRSATCCISVPLDKLFAGFKSVTGRLNNTANPLLDALVTVSINEDLLSEEMKQALNPMVIKVHAALNMPNTPVSFVELQRSCHPAYIKYKFYKQPEHRSIGQSQNKKIYWDDIHVILLGQLNSSELSEFINGPPIDIEVHDRDRIIQNIPKPRTLFGNDLQDDKIANVGTISSKRTKYNAFQGNQQPWDPYGIARLDLNELLLGQRVLFVNIPIIPGPIPEILGRNDKTDGLIGIKGAVDGPESTAMQAGHYLSSYATLKVKVEVAIPLITYQEYSLYKELSPTKECPFGRIIFHFPFSNISFLNRLESLITDINSHALSLDQFEPTVKEAALSTYKLSVEQSQSNELDILTGFHIMDHTMHIFVLEGIRHSGIKSLFEALPTPKERDVKVLYHSNLSFKHRLYSPLDVDICRVKLHDSLDNIVKQPLLFVRDMVQRTCFDGLIRLHQLTKIDKLGQAVKNNLFPSADMIIGISREFGVPITRKDLREMNKIQNTENDVNIHEEEVMPPLEETLSKNEIVHIDNRNDKFEEIIAKRENEQRPQVNHVSINKKNVEDRSKLNAEERAKNPPKYIQADGPFAYNYSIQSLNSTELALNKLRNQLAQQYPGRLFTYSQQYQGATLEPVDTETVARYSSMMSRASWMTLQGWAYPGHKSSVLSNLHPRKPHEARIDSLKEPFIENTLFAKFKPTLPERDIFPWSQHDKDFDVWTKPPPVFGTDEPVTIHLAGESRTAELASIRKLEYDKWKETVVVDDESMHFHRCGTELVNQGPKSSNQIEKLTEIMKDPPKKLGYRKPEKAMLPIPALSVVHYPSVDTARQLAFLPPIERNDRFDARITGYMPGPFTERSLAIDSNAIPAHDYEHKKFASMKGYDFNLYNVGKEFVYKRHAKSLDSTEYVTHLFQSTSSPKADVERVENNMRTNATYGDHSDTADVDKSLYDTKFSLQNGIVIV